MHVTHDTKFKKKLCRVWCISRLDQVHTRHKHLHLCVAYGAICGVYFSLSRHVFWRLLHTWHTYLVSNFTVTSSLFQTRLAYIFLVVTPYMRLQNNERLVSLDTQVGIPLVTKKKDTYQTLQHHLSWHLPLAGEVINIRYQEIES